MNREHALEGCLANAVKKVAELQGKIDSLPADWQKDSSLETWFPLTAEELRRVKDDYARLQRTVKFMEEEYLKAHGGRWGKCKYQQDSEILDWVEAHPDCDVRFTSFSGVWTVYDGRCSEYKTERLGKGKSLREAVRNAIERPYEI